MPYIENFFPEIEFGGFSKIDGTLSFYARVNALIERSSVVLDVGCGIGSYHDDPVLFRRNLRILKGKGKKVIGIDVDPTAKDNPCIDEFRSIEGNVWPIDDASVDLVLCDNVLEHIQNPETFFTQASRVTRKSGYICIRTPNAWNYVAIFSRLIPNKYHAKVTAVVKGGEKEVFPTLYRCNTIHKVRVLLKRHGFQKAVVYGYEAEPSYLSFAKITYWLGVLHQKFAPESLKTTVVAFGQKGE